MSSDDTRHVQTELDVEEYERFWRVARERGLSLAEAGREALVEWVDRQRQADPNDPAFSVLDELDERSGSTTDARTEDDITEEWHGSDVEFRLDDEPQSGH